MSQAWTCPDGACRGDITDEGNRRIDLMPHSSEDLTPMVAALDAWFEHRAGQSPVFRADSTRGSSCTATRFRFLRRR